ncbi:hypothetical protein [Burkholderia lata]|uniref:hypothetical protein n=1 Tax=Burkholderia lata (strain ATCC 17760 / DSM 23089 / LMG 22485 / NCIMB 9086 / R18194 / 383) TaxID=482957 RepID=UPI0020C609F0|nr:hypothetical protein [Burkholderia lata]
MATVLLARATYHRHIVEIDNETWRSRTISSEAKATGGKATKPTGNEELPTLE